MKCIATLGMIALAVVLLQAGGTARANDQTPAALAGQVSSDAEGAKESPMEGVVVTAHKDGSIVSVSVTTDAQGRYAFPENRLEPGQYNIAIRAVGYDLAAPATGEVVAEKTTNLDLKLQKTKDLAGQLSNAEWMMSIPGTEEQKAFLLDCTSCHTLERIVRSTHDAGRVDAGHHPHERLWRREPADQAAAHARSEARAGTPEHYRKAAEYLATINLSAADHWAVSRSRRCRARPAVRRARSSPNTTWRAQPPSRMTSCVDQARQCLVLGFRRALHLQVRSEDAQAHRISDQEIQARRSRRQSLARVRQATARSGSTPCTRARSATLDPEDRRRSNSIRWPRSGTTIACSSISSGCATTSTARSGPRASAPRTFTASISRAANGNASIRHDQLPAGHRYSMYQVISDSQK